MPCCEIRTHESRQATSAQAQNAVRPGPKAHVALGALGGGAIALGLHEIIEGDSQATIPVGVALAVLTGMVAGGVIGWIVYKIRQ